MKNCNSTLLAISFLLACSLQAQMEKAQAYWVHEDHVKPAMVDEYEAVGKKLIENLKKHNIQDEQWITAQTADFRYLFVGRIEQMADLDREMFASLSEKMGAEAVGSLFAEMDKYYTAHFDYVIYLDEELSYMPGGITQLPEGKDYRKFYYLHTTPAMKSDLAGAMKGIRDLYQAKGSKSEYRVYRSGFGAPNDFFMVAIAGQDAVSYEQSSVANDALLGKDAKPAFDKVMEYVTKFEVIPGNMRPDLAYTPE
jgi:hypothetical protein